MHRVGYLLSICFPDEYPGGKNYMLNLFNVLSKQEIDNVKLKFFMGEKTPELYIKDFEKYGDIIKSKLFDRWSLYWVIYKVIYKVFNSHLLLNIFLKKYKIDILSHSDIYGKKLPFKTINWLPDLQFLHLPELFGTDIEYEKKRFSDRLKLSDKVIFSSYDGQKDGLFLLPEAKSKSVVIRPAYKINSSVYNDPAEQNTYLKKNYKIPEKYFYLPNQFWVHKNHMIVFKAINDLKTRHPDIMLLCSGLMDGADSKERGHDEYMAHLLLYLSNNDLFKNIKLLGLIPYRDVLLIIRHSVAVINPSKFEGWSTTVEEAKSIGKTLVLSNLNIHIEQDPKKVYYFNVNDQYQLSEILEKNWKTQNGGPDYPLEKKAKIDIRNRIRNFGEEYLDLLI